MEIKDREKTEASAASNRAALIAVAMMLVSLVAIVITIGFYKQSDVKFIADDLNVLVTVELTVFVAGLIELIGQLIVASFRRRGIEHVGHSIRTIIRGGFYVILTIAIISMLSSNPVLAISIGTVSGIVIGFAMQNLIGNLVAGITLAIIRPIRVGDLITVSGSTGHVREIALIYTVLDTEDSLHYVPSIVMFSTVVIKKKNIGDYKPLK